MVAEGNCLMVGDTKLDIELGRRIGTFDMLDTSLPNNQGY